VLFEESENVADKLQESLKKLCRFLAARLKLRKKLDYLVNERCDEFHDLLPLYLAELQNINIFYLLKAIDQIGKNTDCPSSIFRYFSSCIKYLY